MVAVVVVALLLAVVAGQLELKRKQLSLAIYLPAGVVTLLAVSTQVGPGRPRLPARRPRPVRRLPRRCGC